MPNSLFPRADAATRARLEQDPTLRLANTFDWSKTQLGLIPGWPEALKAAVRVMMLAEVPMAMLVGKRDGVMIYNHGYSLFAGDRHPGLFGRPVLEAWTEVADFNREVMRRGFAGESWYLADEELALHRNGKLEPAWMNLNYSPVLDESGTPLAVLAVVIETTARVKAAMELAESEQRFRTLADTMPQMVWSTLPDGYHDYYNARWYEFTGVPDGSTDGEGWNDMFHADDRERARNVWQRSLATGEPYRIEYRLRHHSGEYRWVLGRALPIRDSRGRIVRWFGTCTDIHDSRLIAEERELVAQELSHRIKNIFAVLNGIISLSARSRPDIKPYADELRQRIFALGEAHDYIRPRSHASSASTNRGTLKELVERLMQPYRQGDGDRMSILGDDVTIDDGAATPLALLFHELATNAAKYGSLSAAGGRVVLTGSHTDDHYHLSWKEIGGPILETGASSGGFGSRMIELSVQGQLNGKLERFWETDGLRVEIDLPVKSLQRSARLHARSAN